MKAIQNKRSVLFILSLIFIEKKPNQTKQNKTTTNQKTKSKQKT